MKSGWKLMKYNEKWLEIDWEIAKIILHGYCDSCYSAPQSKKAVTAHFSSKQLLPLGFAGQCRANADHWAMI